MDEWGQKYMQSTTMLFPCDSSLFHKHVWKKELSQVVVNLMVASVGFPTQWLNNGFWCT